MGACGCLASASTSAAIGVGGGAPRHPQADTVGESGGGAAAASPSSAGPVLLGSRRPGTVAGKEGEGELLVVVRVVKAELSRSCLRVGRMAPHALVVWTDSAGCQWEGSRTRTDQNGHMNPHWEHTCSGQLYSGRGGGDTVEFWVKDKDTCLGVARVTVDDLLGKAASPTADSDCAPAVGSTRQLDLRLDGEIAGHITVQGLLYKCDRKVSCDDGGVPGEVLTRIDPALFQHPVRRVGVAGGTAPFFKLVLNPDALASGSPALLGGITRDYYIGKDLSHAADEVSFYEEVMTLSEKAGKGGMAALVSFLVDYLGVLTAEEDAPPEKRQKPRDLLVMRNLGSGFRKLRMLDIKIGQKTAQAGWQGKSRMAALRGSMVDCVTNSSCEGFRLEGFDGRPPCLESMDPMLDLGVTGDRKVVKKAWRVMLQRMSGAEMLMHFMDTHQDSESTARPDEDVGERLTRVEVAELSHHEIVRRLAGLAVACRQCPVPQKWIGSSVALGFDCGELPPRSTGTADLKRHAVTAIFDWGRSELNTVEKHMQMSDSEQKDRSEFWCYYVGGVDRLAWEAARAYKHRFCTADDWKYFMFTVYDFDSLTANDFIGRVKVPVENTARQQLSITDADGEPTRGQLEISIEWCPYPKGSRLKGAWQVTVLKATDLPAYDKMMMRSTNDAFVEVVAISNNGKNCFRQVTSVKAKSTLPEWNETFEVPVMNSKNQLSRALASASATLEVVPLSAMLPMEEEVHLAASVFKRRRTLTKTLTRLLNSTSKAELDHSVIDRAFADWVSRLDFAAAEQIRKEGGDLSSIRNTHSGSGTSKLLPTGSGSSQCLAVVPSGGVAILDAAERSAAGRTPRTGKKPAAQRDLEDDSDRKCCARCGPPAASSCSLM